MVRSRIRIFAAGCIVAATAAAVIGILAVSVSDQKAAKCDFIEYWVAGFQLIHHANPYDVADDLKLERRSGLEGNKPRITFSPPLLLCPFLPLGLVSPKVGLILWLVILILCLLVSIWIIWVLNGRPDNGLHFCGYMFAPALACLMAGQLGIFLLLAIVLFLYFHEGHPLLAGVSLAPCVWKPHLFLPFFIVLFLWSARRKEWRILAGFLVVVLGSSLITLHLDPQVWYEYSRMMSQTGVLHGFVPTLSVTMRFLVDPGSIWLQFVPELGACLWAVWYFWTRRTRWIWMDQGMLLLLVSAVCTPYAWFTDEAMLLPAVMTGIYRATNSHRSLLPILLAGTVALIEIISIGNMASKYYLWTAPCWLAWYLYATHEPKKQLQAIPPEAMAAID